MIREDMGKDPRGRELKGHLLWWLMSAAALAVAAFFASLALGSTTARAQVTGEFYSGPIEVIDDCGGGTIDFNLSEDRMSIELVFIEDFNADGTPIDGELVSDPGAVPISDGSFSVTFDAQPPEDGEFSVSGTFAGDELTGTVTLSPSTCADVSFTAATAGEEPTTPPEGALVFKAAFEPIFDFLETGTPNCGGGEFIFTVYPDRASIFSTDTRGNTVGGVFIDTFFFGFEPGEIPIDATGHFLSEAPVTEVFSARNEGRFDFDADPQTVSGTLAIYPTADPSAVICEEDYSTATAVLPTTGSGPGAGSGSGGVLWTILAAALGAFGLATTGLAIMRRRSA